MTFPIVERPNISPTTIVPDPADKPLFVQYMNKTYEDMASVLASKDYIFYPMNITSSPQNIINLPNFGAFIICISGSETNLPTLTASLCKSSASSAGTVTPIGSQVGSGSWAGFALTITSTSTNFQIQHNNTGVNGNFNIRIIGTQ